MNNQRWVQKRGLIEGSTYKMTSWATLHLYKVAVMSGNSCSTDLNLNLVMEQRRNVKAGCFTQNVMEASLLQRSSRFCVTVSLVPGWVGNPDVKHMITSQSFLPAC